jgi:hypothetical protein
MKDIKVKENKKRFANSATKIARFVAEMKVLCIFKKLKFN